MASLPTPAVWSLWAPADEHQTGLGMGGFGLALVNVTRPGTPALSGNDEQQSPRTTMMIIMLLLIGSGSGSGRDSRSCNSCGGGGSSGSGGGGGCALPLPLLCC